MNLHQLSPAQLALTPLVRDEWVKIGLDTAPIDRWQVREILTRLYAVADRPAPQQIIHLGSPLQVSMVIAMLQLQDEPICQQVSDRVRGQVLKQLHGCSLPSQAFDIIADQDRFESTIASLTPNLTVLEHIQTQVRDVIRAQFPSLRVWPFPQDFGQFANSLSWYDFIGRLGIDMSRLTPAFDLAKACGMAVLFWDWAFICAKPQWIHFDERNRLYHETGAAIRYPDGFSVFAIHGVRVPEKVVTAPESLTIAEIESEQNAEVRRVMITRYGQERFLMNSGAEEIHRDDFGILYTREIAGDEPLVMVKVVNATPEPDGSYKDYFLRVPPEMTRARQAVAWTFGKEENDYAPAFQT